MSVMPVSIAESTFVPVTSRQAQIRNGANPTTISKFIIPLLQWSRDQLPLSASALLLETSSSSVIQWIREERLRLLPAETTSYDKVLEWAQVLVQRLDAVEKVVGSFVADIYLATSLAYGYFAVVLELAAENATPLKHIFVVVLDISTPFQSILRATDLGVSEEIVEQLALALVDLVALISSLFAQLYKAILGLGDGSFVLNDIHNQYASQIDTFQNRCERVRVAISRHRLQGAAQGLVKGDDFDAIRFWLAPGDPVLARLDENVTSRSLDRVEMTFLWMSRHVWRWRMDQSTHIHLIGRSGSGKTVLTHVIREYLQGKSAAASPLTLSLSISTRIPAEGTMRSIARSLLHQLFTQSIGHTPLLVVLSESFEHSQRTADSNAYDNLLWDTLKRALTCLDLDNQVFLVVDGVDEALCEEMTLLRKLISIIPETANVKLITLGTQNRPTASGQTLSGQVLLEVTEHLVSADISTVVETSLVGGAIFPKLPSNDKETIITDLTAISEGSFLWAKLACRHIRDQESPDQLCEAMDLLRTTKPSVSDFIHLCLNRQDVSMETRRMLVMLAVAQRPLRVAELQTLASILVEQQKVPASETKEESSVLYRLHGLNHLISLSSNTLSLQHSLIKDAVLKLVSPGSPVHPNVDPAIDFLTRLFICLKCSIGESSEPVLTPLDQDTATSLQHSQDLLPYAWRYWPVHYQNLSAIPHDHTSRLAQRLTPYLPVSTACIRLQSTLWAGLPLPDCLRYHELTTDLYRTAMGPNHVATLQCTILLAGLYDRLQYVDQASRMFYDAAMSSRASLTARHPLTLQLAGKLLELTAGPEVTDCQSETMHWRGECLALSVECLELQHGETSDEAGAARRLLAEHQHQTLGE